MERKNFLKVMLAAIVAPKVIANISDETIEPVSIEEAKESMVSMSDFNPRDFIPIGLYEPSSMFVTYRESRHD